MGRKKKYPGHFCWACGRIRANERFGGWGHAHHVCRDCQKLGKEELSYRQVSRDLGRLVTWNGIIPRKHRKSFDRFLNHSNPRIREEAAMRLQQDQENRECLRREWEEEPEFPLAHTEMDYTDDAPY